MADALIRLDGLTKVFGEGAAAFHALRGVNLAIEPGAFVAVMGASGSGKSTMMNIVGCLDTPTSGRFFFRNIAIESLDRDQRARMRRRYLGFVFQGFNLLPRTSAIENVELPLLYRGEPARARRARAMAALDLVGLTHWAGHRPNELSGGQQQRVAIARAIVSQPAVVLADEPTGNLDSERSVEVMGLLRRLNEELGVTVVIVTHDPEMARFARRIILFRDGIVAPGAASQAAG